MRLFPSLILCMLLIPALPFAHSENGFDVTAPSSTPLAAGEDIRIGMSHALSGPTAALGRELLLGSRLYFDKVNREGGVHGRKLKLISYDDGYEPVRTISNTHTLLEKDNAFLLFDYVGTPTSRVAVPIAERAGVPYIGAFTGAGFLRKPVVPVVFNIRASYADETETMVEYLVGTLGLTRIGLFIQDDAYGSTGRKGVRTALEKRNLKVVGVGKYARNTSDISAALVTLKAADPQAVIMVGAYAPSAEFIKQARKIGFNPLFLNVSFVGTQKLVEHLGAEGDGVYITQVMPSPYDTSLPLIQAYQADAKAANLSPASIESYGTLEGYVNAKVLVHMLKATGPNPSRAGLIRTFETVGPLEIDGLPLAFSVDNHQGSQKVYLTQIVSGTVRPVTFTK